MMFHMHPNKSPGPDGFNLAVCQHFCDMRGDDIYSAVNNWLERGFFPSTLNETNICLIPKCEIPNNIKDLRLISLSNMLYNMASKLLTNSVNGYLSKCIS